MATAHRHRTHLPGFDYRTPGGYYVTICSHQRRYIFGEVREGHFLPSPLGQDIGDAWRVLAFRFPSIELDASIVMPNHLHGILYIENRAVSLHAIVQAYKSLTTIAARRCGRVQEPNVWQRGYHEHVIRDEHDLDRIREYIENNPLQWTLDRENLDRDGDDPFDLYMDTMRIEHGGRRGR